MKLKITVIVHPDLIPEYNLKKIGKNKRPGFPWITEWDVFNALQKLGHEVSIVAVSSSLELRSLLKSVRTDLVFNLLEEIDGSSSLDYKVAKICSKFNVPSREKALVR